MIKFFMFGDFRIITRTGNILILSTKYLYLYHKELEKIFIRWLKWLEIFYL